ncbi:hypothetical protein Tco_0002174 [Tanacetum coccineum]
MHDEGRLLGEGWGGWKSPPARWGVVKWGGAARGSGAERREPRARGEGRGVRVERRNIGRGACVWREPWARERRGQAEGSVGADLYGREISPASGGAGRPGRGNSEMNTGRQGEGSTAGDNDRGGKMPGCQGRGGLPSREVGEEWPVERARTRIKSEGGLGRLARTGLEPSRVHGGSRLPGTWESARGAGATGPGKRGGEFARLGQIVQRNAARHGAGNRWSAVSKLGMPGGRCEGVARRRDGGIEPGTPQDPSTPYDWGATAGAAWGQPRFGCRGVRASSRGLVGHEGCGGGPSVSLWEGLSTGGSHYDRRFTPYYELCWLHRVRVTGLSPNPPFRVVLGDLKPLGGGEEPTGRVRGRYEGQVKPGGGGLTDSGLVGAQKYSTGVMGLGIGVGRAFHSNRVGAGHAGWGSAGEQMRCAVVEGRADAGYWGRTKRAKGQRERERRGRRDHRGGSRDGWGVRGCGTDARAGGAVNDLRAAPGRRQIRGVGGGRGVTEGGTMGWQERRKGAGGSGGTRLGGGTEVMLVGGDLYVGGHSRGVRRRRFVWRARLSGRRSGGLWWGERGAGESRRVGAGPPVEEFGVRRTWKNEWTECCPEGAGSSCRGGTVRGHTTRGGPVWPYHGLNHTLRDRGRGGAAAGTGAARAREVPGTPTQGVGIFPG